MIRFSDIRHNPVLSTTTATTVGRVGSLVVDPRSRTVVALLIQKSKGAGNILLWDSITAIGPDVVTVDSDQRLVKVPADLEKGLVADVGLNPVGHRVLTDHGRDLGKLKDLEFDDDGKVTSLTLKDAFIEGDRLIGIGPYATVVRS